MALNPYTKLWWVPEELNLSTPAALFRSRPGYSRLSGKGPVLAVRFERTLERVLGSPPLPLGYASMVHRRDSNPHCPRFEGGASCQLGLRWPWSARLDSN